MENCVDDLEDERSCSRSKVGGTLGLGSVMVGAARQAVDLGEVAMAVRCSVDSWQNVLLGSSDSWQPQLQSSKNAAGLGARVLFVIECSCLFCVPGYVSKRLELELYLDQVPDHSQTVPALAESSKLPAVAGIYRGTPSYLFVSALCLPFGPEFVPVLADSEVYSVLVSGLYCGQVL